MASTCKVCDATFEEAADYYAHIEEHLVEMDKKLDLGRRLDLCEQDASKFEARLAQLEMDVANTLNKVPRLEDQVVGFETRLAALEHPHKKK